MSTEQEPPEWQGESLGSYGPHERPHDMEPFDVERAPSTATCGHFEDGWEGRNDPDVRACERDAVYRFYVRDENYSWTLRDRCQEHADGPDPDSLALPRAEKILWQDAAEAYVVCSDHYHQHKRDQWAGSTANPNQDELREYLRERIENGTPCAFCKRDTGEIA